jgi:hypothetical protein
MWLMALTAAVLALAPGRVVPCGESIEQTPFPYSGSNEPRYQYREVLGAVSVPGAYLTQIVPTGERPWTHWRKAGIVVRAGAAVTITVPAKWRRRAAIVWGNADGAFRSLQLAACPGEPNVGLAYAGGFLLRGRSVCLPLIFTVGDRRATVRFGLGRRCS